MPNICYVLSEYFYEQVTDNIPRAKSKHQAKEIVNNLRDDKREANNAEELFENKRYRGYKHIRQIRIGDWRIASVYLKGISIAEVVQLNYIYNKGKSGEPNKDYLRRINQQAEKLLEQSDDWPPSEESEYLDNVRTELPNID